MKKVLIPVLLMAVVLWPALASGQSYSVNIEPASASPYVETQLVSVQNESPSDLVVLIEADTPMFTKVERKVEDEKLLQFDWRLLKPSETIDLELLDSFFPAKFLVSFFPLSKEGVVTYTVSTQ